MSFYNVTNPTAFSVVSDVRKSLVTPGKLTRSAAIQSLTSFTGNTATSPITPEQLVQGVLFVNCGGGNRNFYLPRASDLITLLMGPGGFDVSSNDIFTFRIFNISSSGDLSVLINNATGETNSGTISAITPGTNRAVNLQITITASTSGTTYSYAMF
jgi:hypothetical protein